MFVFFTFVLVRTAQYSNNSYFVLSFESKAYTCNHLSYVSL